MPEYLSPAVYVEEVSTGPRPIEGVSTSTSGMVGVTERGPENVPILVTSIGDYRRIFGGALAYGDFTNAGRVHGHTHDAVKAFFENGGRRNYVVRVAPGDAVLAERHLFDRGAPGAADTFLLRDAPRDSGTALNTPLIYALQANPPAIGDSIRVGDGSRSEYRTVAAIGNTVHVALSEPLARSHSAPVQVDEVDRTALGAFAGFTMTTGSGAGDGDIVLTEGAVGDAAALAGLAMPVVLEVGAAAREQFRVATAITDLGGGQAEVTLASPLGEDVAAGDPVTVLDVGAPTNSQTLAVSAGTGDSLIYLDNLAGGYDQSAPGVQLVVIDAASAVPEVRRIGTFSQMTLQPTAYQDYAEGARIDLMNMADDDRVVLGAPVPTATAIAVDRIDGLTPGMAVDVNGDVEVIDAIDAATNVLTLRAALPGGAPAAGDAVIPAAKATTADADAGDIVLALNNRLGLAQDDVLRIGAVNPEYITIAEVREPRGVAPDAGTVILAAPLQRAHAAGSAVRRQHPPTVDTARQASFAVIAVAEDADDVYVSDGQNYAAGEVIGVSLPGGGQRFHTLSAVDTTLAPVEIELDATLDLNHMLGAPIAGRDPLIRVVAKDRGAWGNRLRVAVRDAVTPLVQADLTASSPVNTVISLSNYTGVETGTVLEFFDPATGAQVGDFGKVIRVDRAAGEVELAAIPAPAVTGFVGTLSVRSREFELQVFLLQRPDPAVPSRNNTVIDSEQFILTMDPRHSMYLNRVVGTTWVPGADFDDDGNPLRESDRRSVGASQYIVVRDMAAGNQAILESVRLGPEPLQDVLVNGLIQPARLALDGGDDAVFAMGNAMYLGIESNEPRDRRGIPALANRDDISIVSVPGQVTQPVQQALINHCERERYRFAVLDGPPPNLDTLTDVQLQRQQFDTNYAAMYHPWVTELDPLGNLASIQQVPLPPSGYVTGIYARVDNERGVHKAPANEVIRNITGLSRYLNQREHDILNPFPTNINVIRDFRRQNRGIRVWGGRCITSDSQYKYVNVRRLLMFIEASIDRGLQYAVFEPNAEPLWARVRRSISSFLTVVWRNGALEGTTAEQAFFVRCDRTTMTQTDIDNGRLICLVGVAPVKPAEFVIVRIGLKTADAEN